MKKCKDCKKLKPLDDFGNDWKARDGKKNHCKPCANLRSKKWKAANKEKVAETGRKWRAKNPTYHRDYHAEYRETHRGQLKGYQIKYYRTRRQARPPWYDYDKVNAFYDEANYLTALTKIPHQVDHIIPLQGKNVCGLHVQDNLQVITASENAKKGNKYG